MNKLRCTISSLLHREYMMLPAKDTDAAVAVNESLTNDEPTNTRSNDRPKCPGLQSFLSRYLGRETYVRSVCILFPFRPKPRTHPSPHSNHTSPATAAPSSSTSAPSSSPPSTAPSANSGSPTSTPPKSSPPTSTPTSASSPKS